MGSVVGVVIGSSCGLIVFWKAPRNWGVWPRVAASSCLVNVVFGIAWLLR
jgi:hypothetical protein